MNYFCLISAKLELHTIGFNGEIWIKGVKTGQYLAMNSTGGVSLVVSIVEQAKCEFQIPMKSEGIIVPNYEFIKVS